MKFVGNNMEHVNLLGICVFFFLNLFSINLSAQEYNKFVLKKADVSIIGNTNINSFKCDFQSTSYIDTLYVKGVLLGSDEIEIEGLKLALLIDNFDCGNKIMTKDFRNTLKSKTYPFIKLEIKRLDIDKDDLNQSETHKTTSISAITIGDITHREIIEESFITAKNKTRVLGGEHHMKMTSYNIEPPVKFLGTVRVEDELTFQFELTFERVF